MSEACSIETTNVLGCKVHDVDMDLTLETIREFVKTDKPHLVVTADASAIVIAQSDPQFKDIINNAAMVTPDGVGVVFGAKFSEHPIRERVSGCDICENVLRIAAEDGFSVYFFGAKPGVAEKAAERMTRKYPGLKVAGTRNGYFDDEKDTPEIVKSIRESGAKALFVAMGIPKQEKWIVKNMDSLGISVAMGVGGTFDVLSGNVKRAPDFYRNHGLEWFYRLVKDRTKIIKVILIPKFVLMVLFDYILRGGKKRKSIEAKKLI